MSDSTPYSLPPQPGRWRAIALAAVVHAALFGFLWFGVNWQNQTPVAVEAEVWSPQARDAAPRAVADPPAPAPVPMQEKPVPRPRPEPAIPPPAARLEVPQPKAPDIALEREKQKRERAREAAAEEERQQAKEAVLQQREQARDAERKKALASKTEEQLRQKQQAQADQKRADQRELKREQQQAALTALAAEAAARKKAEDGKRAAAEKQRRADATSDQQMAAQREDQLRRLTESAGSGGSGDAPKSRGSRADPSYTQKVGAKIRNNTVFNGADEVSGNPSVEIAVELLPDGSIRRLRKTKASGVPGFDEAVSRAIEKSQPFPPDKSGQVPSGFTVSHKPKDQ